MELQVIDAQGRRRRPYRRRTTYSVAKYARLVHQVWSRIRPITAVAPTVPEDPCRSSPSTKEALEAKGTVMLVPV